MNNQCKLLNNNKKGTAQFLVIPGSEFTKVLLEEMCEKDIMKK